MTSQLSRTLFETSATHEDMLAVLFSLFFTIGREGIGGEDETTWGLLVNVHDEPGTGKSTIAANIGKKWMTVTRVHSLAQHPAEDIGGYCVPNKTRTAMDAIPAAFFNDLNASDSALLILDEFGSVEEHKQAAALSLLTERMAGGTRLAGHVRCIALGNPPEVGANGVPQAMSTANRFFHMPWIRPAKGSFRNYLRTAGKIKKIVEKGDREAVERKVVKAWPAAYAKAVAIVDGYLERFPADEHCMPKGYGRDTDEGELDELRWPSPRVWENVCRALAGALIHGLTDVQVDYMVRCALPEGLATKFVAFYHAQDLPTPESVLDDPESYKISKRIDKTQAVLSMTVAYLADETVEKRSERAANWWKLAGIAAEHKNCGKDFVKVYARQMSLPTADGGCGLGSDVVPEAGPVVTSLFEVLFEEKKAKKAAKSRR